MRLRSRTLVNAGLNFFLALSGKPLNLILIRMQNSSTPYQKPRYLTILPDSTVRPGLLIEDDENLFIDLDRKAVSITRQCTDYYTDRGIRWVTMCEGNGGDYILDASDNVWYNTDYIMQDFDEDQCELIDRDEALFCIDLKRLEFYNPKTKTWDKIR